jgi:hypothetical protein
MKSRPILPLLTLIAAAAFGIPAHAQQITSVNLNDSSANAAWNSWDSIYGTSLPTGSGTYVTVTYPESYVGGYGGAENEISATSANQTYWYDSSTQINLYIFAVSGGGTPIAGCVYYYPNYICDTVQACGSGLCSNVYTTTFTGTP